MNSNSDLIRIENKSDCSFEFSVGCLAEDWCNISNGNYFEAKRIEWLDSNGEKCSSVENNVIVEKGILYKRPRYYSSDTQYYGITISKSQRCGKKLKMTSEYEGMFNDCPQAEFESSDSSVALTNNNEIILQTVGTTDISYTWGGKKKLIRSITVYDNKVYSDDPDVDWYIPHKIKLGYFYHAIRGEGDGLTLAVAKNIMLDKNKEYLTCNAERIINNDDSKWNMRQFAYYFSGPHAGAGSHGNELAGYLNYATYPGKLDLQLQIYNTETNKYTSYGNVYSVEIEEPVIKTNEKTSIEVGESLTLCAKLENTDLVDESIKDYLDLVSEYKTKNSESDRYCVCHNLIFQPQYDIIEGKNLVKTDNGDFTRTLTASQKITFTGAGRVKIRVKYKPIGLCAWIEEGCSRMYSPEKVITINVNLPHKHSFAQEWTYNNDYHWHKASCGHSDKIEKKPHMYLAIGKLLKKPLF